MRAAILCLTIAACAPTGRTLTPTVIVDDAFTDAELEAVMSGLDTWEAATRRVHFERKAMGHAAIIGAALSRDADTVYLVRVTSTEDRDCPGPNRNVTQGAGAEETHGVICIVAPLLQSLGFLPRGVAHEMGHAMGLKHRAEPSVMATEIHHVSECPTQDDVDALLDLY